MPLGLTNYTAWQGCHYAVCLSVNKEGREYPTKGCKVCGVGCKCDNSDKYYEASHSNPHSTFTCCMQSDITAVLLCLGHFRKNPTVYYFWWNGSTSKRKWLIHLCNKNCKKNFQIIFHFGWNSLKHNIIFFAKINSIINFFFQFHHQLFLSFPKNWFCQANFHHYKEYLSFFFKLATDLVFFYSSYFFKYRNVNME